MSYLKLLLYTYLLGLLMSFSYPQNKETRFLTGLLIEDGAPIIGEYIYQSNQPNNQTISDMDGKFTLEIPKYESVKIKVHMLICSDYPNEITVREGDADITLLLNGCNFKKIKP